jgi:hypothetical protein
MTMGLLLAAMVSSTIWAGEHAKNVVPPAPPREVDLKLRMKALIAEALKAGDLWTAIQADAFASQKLGVRSGGVLGGSEILGDPLYAFPTLIGCFQQHGDLLMVVSGDRLYRLGLDGRPLGLSLPLGMTPHYSGLSHDGRLLMLVDRQTFPGWQLKVSVRAMPAGNEVFGTTVPLTRGEYVFGAPQVSVDGSAMVIGLLDADDENPRLQVVRTNGKNVSVRGHARPRGIGAEGTWALVDSLDPEADSRAATLLQGGMATAMHRAVAGPGVAAVIPAGEHLGVQLVGRDGMLTPLPLPVALSSNAQLVSLGDHLIIGSGWVRASRGEVDLLGNPVEAAAQPYTTCLVRWSDLESRTGDAPPLLQLRGPFTASATLPNTVFIATGHQLMAYELTAAEPVGRPLMDLGGDVHYLDGQHGRLVMWMRDGSKLVVSEEGKELWRGPGGAVRLHDPWHAEVAHEGAPRGWVRLAEDPAARKTSVPALPATDDNDHEFRLDRYHRRLLAFYGRRRWAELDPHLATMVHHATPREAAPQVVPLGTYPWRGNLVIQAARLVPRFAEPTSEAVADAAQYWNPRDAWRVGGTTVVLDHHGQVFTTGRKRGTFVSLGSVDRGDFLALGKQGELVVAQEEGQIVGLLAAGPTLVGEGPSIGSASDPLPEGPWRVKNQFFIPPRGQSLMWDAARCGFTPRHLRSPPGSPGLLVVTDSLVIDLDPVIGKQLGTQDRQGLRDLDD